MHGTYGGRLFSGTRSGGDVAVRKLGYLVPGIAVLVFLAWILVDYFFIESTGIWGDVFEYGWEVWVALGFLVVPIGYMLWVLAVLRFYTEVEVYEKGLILHYGSNRLEIGFNELDGVTGFKRIVTRVGMVPTWVSHRAEIHGGHNLHFPGARTPELRQFADTLEAAYHDFVIQPLNAGNIKQARIKFGIQGLSEISLERGELLGVGRSAIPLEQLTEFNPRAMLHGNTHADLMGIENGVTKKLAVLRLEDMFNLSILARIIADFGGNAKKE